MSLILLPIILFLGTGLRFYNNTAVALWHDEAFSALYLRYSWQEMLYRIGLDVHPPLYYFILRIWSYFAGTSLLSLRLLSIIFGVLTIWAGYLFVKAVFGNKKLALLSALLIAINSFQIQYSLEARMYTLGTFLALLSSYFLVRALENKKFWLWYAVFATAGLYTHYYLLFSVAAQGLYVAFYIIKARKVRLLIRAVGYYLLALILYMPWLPTFFKQVVRVQQNYWIPPLNRWSIPSTIWKMIFGGQGMRNSVLAVATVVSIFLIVYYLKKTANFHKWLILLNILVPLAGAVVISFKTNLYLDRYFVFASLFFSILVVGALYEIPKFTWRYSLILLLIFVSIFAFFKNWKDLNIKNKPGMDAVAKFINRNAKPNDKIYVGSSFVFFTFKYYNSTPIKPLLYSPSSLKSIPHFSGTALLTDHDLVLDFRQAQKNSTVWLLWTTGFGGSKPQVPSNWRQVEEKGYQDAPGFKGRIMVTKYRVN